MPFLAPCSWGSKSWKSRLCQSMDSIHFALPGHYWGMYYCGDRTHPAPAHPHLLCQQMWTCFPPFLLPHLVCSFLSFNILLTHFWHYTMSFEPPQCSQHHWGWLCKLFFVWQPHLYLDCPNHFSLVQAGLESIGISYAYRFHPFLCVSGKCFTIYSYFSLNLYPLPLQPIFHFLVHSHLFLGDF